MLEIVKPRVELITPKYNPDWADQALRLIEECGRVSHKSEDRIKEGSAEPFIRKIAINWGHESILEHFCFTVCFVGSRTFSHQLVRHRIGAYTQTSQRYCDYSGNGQSDKLKIIVPPSISDIEDDTKILVDPDATDIKSILDLPGGGIRCSWIDPKSTLGEYLLSANADYNKYKHLRAGGIPAEDAREVLPNCTATEVYTTFNLRQWRHFFTMRMDKHAQWQIKDLAGEVHKYFQSALPLLVENLKSHSGETL